MLYHSTSHFPQNCLTPPLSLFGCTYRSSKSSLLDDPGDDAPNGDFVVRVHGDGREAIVVFTTRAQHDAAGGSVNPLDAEFSIKETHRFTVVVGLNGLVDHQDVALVHARSGEGYFAHAEEECRRAVGNQRLRDVQRLGVRGRHGSGG